MAAPEESADTLFTEVIISGIPVGVSEDHLINFLECKVSDCHVKDVQFKKKGAAIVSFETPLDMQLLQNACESESLKGQALRVLPVDKRGAVLIHRPWPQTSTNSFKFYLSNKKRSGGSPVLEIHRDNANMFLVAYFRSVQDAEEVAKRPHTLEKQELQLELFDPNFGELPDCSEDPSLATPPESDLFMTEQSDSTSSQPMEIANNELSLVPSGVEGSGGSSSEEFRKDMLHATLPENKAKFCVKVVSGLCPLYLKVLDVFSSCISEQLYDVHVTVEGDNVKIQGEQNQVEKTETLVLCLCERQMSSKYVSRVAAFFRGWDEVFEEIECCVDRREYSLAIQEGPFSAEEFCIRLVHSCTSLSFDEFLSRHVSWKSVAVKSQGAEELVGTTSWDDFRENDMEEKFGSRISVVYCSKDRQIDIVGVVTCLDEAVKSVELFLNNLHDEQRFILLPSEKEFLQKFWLNKNLASGTGADFAEMNLEGLSLTVKGSRAGVRHKVRRLESFRKNFKCNRAILTHPKLSTLQTKNGEFLRDLVRTVCEENGCVITELPDPQVAEGDEDQDDGGQWVATALHSFTLPGQKQALHVIEGRADELRVDAVIVCCAESTFQPASVVLAQGARPKNQSSGQEHRSLSQGREGLRVTQPGGRPCQAVIQVCFQHYFPAQARTSWSVSLKKMMADIFAACDHHGFTSLALPVFGVDVGDDGSQPIDVAAKTLTKCVTDQCCSQGWSEGGGSSTSLQHVCLCSPRAACLHALCYTLTECLPWIMSPPAPRAYSFLPTDAPKPRRRQLPSNAIEVKKGDISRAQVDVLVVPCDIDIDLDLYKSAVTKSLLRGGSAVQSSLHKGESWYRHEDMETRNEELAERHILTGKGGTLNAQFICYVYLPPWGPNARQVLTDCLEKSLREASSRRCKSLAVTALGAGKLDYPARCAARTGLGVVSEFLEREATSLTNVQFVIYDQTTCEIYQEELWGLMKHQAWSSTPESSLPPLVYPYHTIPGSSYSQVAQQGSSVDGGGRGKGRTDHSRSQADQAKPYYTGKCPDSISIGSIKLRIKMGNIVRETCDAVVNSTNDDFDFRKGGVSRAFEHACGDFLIRLCKEKKNMKEMRKNGIVVTQAPGLTYAQAILHLDLARFHEKPKETLLKCFTALQSKRPACKSVAFPALGTGASQFNGPEYVVVRMKEALRDLKNPKHLEEVRIVVSGQQLFHRLVSKLHPSSTTHHTPRVSSPYPRPSSSKEAAATYPAPLPPTSAPAASYPTSPPSRILATKLPRSKWADRNSLSFFIFSDKEESRQKASMTLAEKLESYLGPVPQEPARVPDTHPWGQEREYQQPGCFTLMGGWGF